MLGKKAFILSLDQSFDSKSASAQDFDSSLHACRGCG